MTTRVGWYVHHHGTGHLHRAKAVAAQLAPRGVEVTVLSSLPAQDWAPWVELPRDDTGGADATANGVLHWAPVDDPGHRERLATIARWAVETGASAAVVDTSVELTVWLRTLGVPTVLTTLPGVRDDRPHRLGLDIATAVVAAWPRELAIPDHLRPVLDRTTFVGGISRFAGRPAPSAVEVAALRPATGRHVVLLGNGGGTQLTEQDLAAARAATPGWTWTVAGPLGRWYDDVWPLLHAADVVVAGAGQGSVADLAAAGARAVVVPQERPFVEQVATGRVLAGAGLAVVPEGPVAADDWAGLLDRALALDPAWERWQVDGAAARYADVVERVARTGRAGAGA